MHKRLSILLDPWVQGTIFGLLSAIGYTATNAFLRSVTEVDDFWVSAVKAVPTTLLVGPWLLWQLRRGDQVTPSWQSAVRVLAAGLLAQLGGNVAFQWALGQIGLAATVPLTLGGMIVAASTLARVFLNEPIPLRTACAMTLLIAAIVLLSVGAEEVSSTTTNFNQTLEHGLKPAIESGESSGLSAANWKIVCGVMAAIGSGFAYAVLNVAIRGAVTRGASMSFTLTSVSMMGILSLGLLSYFRIGWEGMAATSQRDWMLMILAGVGNALSFLALTISLRLTSVVYVNALNATQAAMAAFAGAVFFQEILSPWLMLGLGLTVAGLLLMRQGKSAEKVPVEEI